jgi:PEP-CTERM motif
MKHQALRPIAMMLSVLLATAAPAKAGTIHFADVMQAVADGRRGPSTDLRLRAIQQQGGKTAPGLVASTQSTTAAGNNGNSANAPDGSTAGNAATSIISQDPAQQGTVETIDLGDVTGTVCDCGEIPVEGVARRGFPWLPFLGVPLICLTGICSPDDEETPECVSNCGPGPTPTPPIPEPATLLLFGSGLLALGAGARRRRGIKALEEATREQEVV